LGIVYILIRTQINQIYKYAFYRLCKADDSLDPDNQSRDHMRQVNISLRANRLESEVIFQMMTLFEQQQDADGGGSSGCTLRTDLRENRIQYLLDPGAAIHLNRLGKICALLIRLNQPLYHISPIVYQYVTLCAF